MTREDAVTTLKDISEMVHKQKEIEKSTLYGILDSNNEPVEALDMAIKALEQEPCDDCISRQATVERLCKVAEFMNEKRNGLGSPYVMAALFIQDNKDEFPSVTPKPKTGHWIEEKSEVYKCSNCGRYALEWGGKLKMSRYCPNCGAKMIEPQESEEKE